MKLLALDTSTKKTGIALLDTQTQKACFIRQEMTTHSEVIIPLIAACLEKQGWKKKQLEGIVCGAGPGSFTGLRIGLATAKGLCFALKIPLVLVSSLEALAQTGMGFQPEFIQKGTEERPTLLEENSGFRKDWAQEKPTLACVYASQGMVYARLIFPKEEQPAIASVFTHQKNTIEKAVPKLLQDALWTKEELFKVLLHLSDLADLSGSLQGCGDGFTRYPELLIPQIQFVSESSPSPLVVAWLGAKFFAKGELASLQDSVPHYLMPSAAEQNRS